MFVNVTKIFQMMKSKCLLSTEKDIIESEKNNDLEVFKVYMEIDKKL